MLLETQYLKSHIKGSSTRTILCLSSIYAFYLKIYMQKKQNFLCRHPGLL